MALPIDDIELAWKSLSTSSDTTGWRSISISVIGKCSLHAGLAFPSKEEALLASFSSHVLASAEKLPDGQGFSVLRIERSDDGKTWLALTRKTSGSVDLFSTMVSDVVDAMQAEAPTDEPRLLRIFLGRIKAWQEFMRKGQQGLSPDAEIGLIGELSILQALLDAGVPCATATEAWVGPFDGIQDFELGTGAIEVKATLSAVGFPAKIGSLEQLDSSTRQPLFLAGARLKQTVNGQSLPNFVDAARQTVHGDAEAVRLLSERVLAAGYVDTHADHYPRRFDIAEVRVLEVDESFPRLTRGSVPIGIRNAQYEIDLDKAAGKIVGLVDALKKLGAI